MQGSTQHATHEGLLRRRSYRCETLPWVARVALAVGITMMGIGWISAACHWAPRSLAARLAAASPACTLNVVLPLLFVVGSEPLSRAFSIFLISWLASFKALALAVGRGASLAVEAGVGSAASRLQVWALYRVWQHESRLSWSVCAQDGCRSAGQSA